MQIKYVIPLIVLVLFLAGGTYYYQTQNQENNFIDSSGSPVSSKNDGIVLGNNDSTNNSSIDLYSITGDDSEITTGEVYVAVINQIRNEIIKDINELNSRIKYKTVFDDKAIIDYTNEVLDKNKNFIDQIKNLNIDPKFTVATEKNIESLEKISESLDALKKSYNIEDKTEAQKQKELYAYNLEQSDSVYKSIKIPK